MRFALLGPLVVVGDSGQQTSLSAPRLRVLLAALLLRANMPVSSDALVEAVWDGAVPPAAIQTLRSYVRRLRRVLGPGGGALIQACNPGYQIRLEGAELDVLEFETLCGQTVTALHDGSWGQASDTAIRALELWRGAPLQDVPSRLLYDELVPRLEHLRMQALEDRAEADLHLGRHEQLVLRLQDLTAQHPLRERFHAQLMLAFYRCNRRAEALESYQHARRALVQELGVEPGPELRGLYERVLAEDTDLLASPQDGLGGPHRRERAAGVRLAARPPSAALGVPRQLPGTTAHFCGRADELAALNRSLDDVAGATPGAVVISAVGGTAGVGKTALAVHWAHQVAHWFGDGQLYVNLRGFDPSGVPVTPVEATRGFLDALGVPTDRIPQDLAAQAGLYRSLMASRQMLIMLDNARDEQQVRPLLPAGLGCLVIITSRRQLTGLAAADGASLLTLDVLSHAEARQMLAIRLGRKRVAAEPDAVDQVVSLCARLPLALAIAAARAAARPGLPLAALASELRHAPGRLDALDTADPAVSVRAVFSWSARQLGPEAVRVFGLLGLHPGPDITASAAASLAGIILPAAERVLRELRAANLLTEHLPGRYACHDLLRSYAAEQAPAAGKAEGREATERMLDHYLHTACAAALLLSPSRQPLSLVRAAAGVAPEQMLGHQQAMAWFEAEHQVLLAVVARAARTGYDVHAWQLPWAMADFLDRRGHWHDSAAVQRTALAAASGLGDIPGRAMAGRALGKACAWLTDYDQARTHLADSLALYQQLGDRGGQARVHQSLLWVAERQARYAEALGHAEQALTLFRAIADQAGQAAALNAVGWCHVLLGDPHRASAACRQALVLNTERGNRRGEALTWDSLGYAEHQLGNFAEAAACYQRALGLFREFGDRFYEAEILTHLGDTRHAHGEHHAARGAWQQALDILDDLHHPQAERLEAKLGRR